MQGVRFRVPIDHHAAKENEIPILFFDYFIGRDPQPKNIRFVDQTSKPIPCKIKPLKNIWEVFPSGGGISLMLLISPNGSTK